MRFQVAFKGIAMRSMIVAGVLAATLFSSSATAVPILYDFTGQLSGSLAGEVFTLADVRLSLASDTDTVFQPLPAARPSLYNSASGPLQFTIGGASGTFDAAYNAFSITFSNGNALVGLTETGASDLIDIVDPALSGYDLRTAAGSVTNTPLDFLNFGTVFSTSLGDLIFSDDNNASVAFTATLTAVPEPASWAMLIGGLGIIGVAMRRRQPLRVTHG